MSDGELLELAAKAAGLGDGPYDFDERTGWNPLTNDGDAFWLAHKLGLLTDVPVWPRTIDEARRAIVRAAAEIGKRA